MAIDTTNSYQEFPATGSAYFAFNFNYRNTSEIYVGQRTADNTFIEITPENYQVIPSPNTDGGQIRFIANPSGSQIIDNPPAIGTVIRIERRQNPISNATWQIGLEMEELVEMFDKIWRAIQENTGRFDNTIQTFATQHGLKLFELLAAHDNKLLYWDNDTKTITPTEFPKEDVVQATNGMWLREVSQDGQTWLEYTKVNPATPGFQESNWKPVFNLTALLNSIIPPKPDYVNFEEPAPLYVTYHSNGTAALTIGYQGA
jgi:hypothetical protein